MKAVVNSRQQAAGSPVEKYGNPEGASFLVVKDDVNTPSVALTGSALMTPPLGVEQEVRETRPRTKKDFVYWEGGVKFGGMMALITAGGDMILHPERYLPLWPPTLVVWFNWLWMLTIHPILFFAAGCLFGLLMWAMFGQRLQDKLEE